MCLLCILKVAFVGFVTCTVFLRTRLHPTDETNGELYLSCLFFGLIHMMFNGFSELSLLIFRLPVFYKQRDNLFHPAWAWSVASFILRLPYSIIESIVWSIVVYYLVGFAPSVGRYFHLLLQMFSFCSSLFVSLMRFLFVLQVLPFYALVIFNTPNGVGSVSNDGFNHTRSGHC